MSQVFKASSTLSDAFGTLVVRGIGILLMFASTTLTARMLGPEEYGTYTAALSLALLLATLSPMGSDRLLVRNLSTIQCSIEAGRETAMAHLCSAIVAMLLLTGSLGAWLISDRLLNNPKWAQTSLMASILFLPLTVTYLRQWVAIPIVGTRRAVMPEQTFLPLCFASTLLLTAATGLRLTAFAASLIYAGILLLVWAGSLQARPLRSVYLSAWKTRRDAGRASVAQQFRDGLPFVILAIGAILSQACLPLVIAFTCGFVDSGYFALAMPFAALAAVPLGVFNLSMIPRCARHFAHGEYAEASHAVRSAATATFALASVISVFIWLLSPQLTWLLGEEYSTVRRLLPPLLLAVMVDCLTGPTIPVMQTMKMEATYALSLFAYLPVQLGLIGWLGHVAGVEGAATAYLLSRCLWNILIVLRIYQVRGLIMLPYLRASQAVYEMSGPSEIPSRIPLLRHRSWSISPASQETGTPVRAAS